MSSAVSCLAAPIASLVLSQGASAQVNEKIADMAGGIELLRSVAQTGRQAVVARADVAKFGKAIPTTKVARFYQIENKLGLLQTLGHARNIPLARK